MDPVSQYETRLGLQCQTPFRSYPLSLIHTPCSLFPSTVLFTKFRCGILLWLLWFLLSLSQAKVKSTPSPRPKTGVWQKVFLNSKWNGQGNNPLVNPAMTHWKPYDLLQLQCLYSMPDISIFSKFWLSQEFYETSFGWAISSSGQLCTILELFEQFNFLELLTLLK